MIGATAQLLCLLAALLTALPIALPRARSWWIRIWDFPRLQLAVAGALGVALAAGQAGTGSSVSLLLPAVAVAAVAWQIVEIWRYTPLAPREVQRSVGADDEQRVSLLVSNVLQDNRDASRLLAEIRERDPDLVVCLETDGWWVEQLDVLTETHPHVVRHPLSNAYGIMLHSRLPLEDSRVEFLIEDDVPSIQATVRLPGGRGVWLNCLHPRPPVPGESGRSTERDAELVVVAKRVRDATRPVIVCGDLNDVAWSHTTRLFQRLSGLLDPRKGRGFYGTFHARYPFLRFPLDHVFHSASFRLIEMRRLSDVGSDHLPLYLELSLEPDAKREQETPTPRTEDEVEARETVAEARAEQA